MENIIILLVVGLIVGLACGYIYKSKKSGKRCIGCPDSGTCGSCSGCCGSCSGHCSSCGGHCSYGEK